jgi:hypothetical protein
MKKVIAWALLRKNGIEISTAKLGSAIAFLSGLGELLVKYNYMPDQLEKPFAALIAIGLYVFGNGVRNATEK